MENCDAVIISEIEDKLVSNGYGHKETNWAISDQYIKTYSRHFSNSIIRSMYSINILIHYKKCPNYIYNGITLRVLDPIIKETQFDRNVDINTILDLAEKLKDKEYRDYYFRIQHLRNRKNLREEEISEIDKQLVVLEKEFAILILQK